MVGFKFQQRCGFCKKLFSSDKQQVYCNSCQGTIKNAPKEIKKVEKEKAVFRLKKPDLGYSSKLFILNEESISKFVFPKNRRRLSSKQVLSLCRSLQRGEHFDSPLVVNEVEGLYRVLDGNHRITAFNTLLKRDSCFSLEVLLVIYKELSEDEEILAFRRWNAGKVQSTDDFIQSIAHNISFIRWLKDDFPLVVTVYKERNSVSVRLLAGAFLAAKRSDDTGYGLKRDNFVKDLEELEEKDYEWLKSYIADFIKVFGKPEVSNPYYKQTFFTALMYLVYERNDKNGLWGKIKEKILGNEEILEFNKFSGREANRKIISLIFDKLKIKPELNL